MFDPPDGYADLEGDSRSAPYSDHFFTLDVDDVGPVQVRAPMPNAVTTLATAGRSDIKLTSRSDYLVLFVRNHLGEGELERIYREMITGDMPSDAIEQIARAIATADTARPTQPSSR